MAYVDQLIPCDCGPAEDCPDCRNTGYRYCSECKEAQATVRNTHEWPLCDECHAKEAALVWDEIIRRLREAPEEKLAEIVSLGNSLIAYDYGPGRKEEQRRLIQLEEEVGLAYEPMNDAWRLFGTLDTPRVPAKAWKG